jgi:signal transduction histidine kinase
VLGRLLEIEEEQRNQLAHDLHDDTVQVMAATLLRLETAALEAEGPARKRFEDSVATLRAALERTRQMMFDLRPPLLLEKGLDTALCDLAHTYAHDPDWDVECRVSVGRLPEAVEGLVYRTIREALINARKHAKAGHVRVVVECVADTVFCEVADDGVGFDAHKRLPIQHLGLRASRERIELAGGAFEVRSRRGEGTTVLFRVPIYAHERGDEATSRLVGAAS